MSIADLYLVNVYLVGVTDQWEKFGHALKLESLTLRRIKANNIRDVDTCFTKVLAAWLDGEDRSHGSPAPNWEEAITALRSLNMREQVDQLIQKLASECAYLAQQLMYIIELTYSRIRGLR